MKERPILFSTPMVRAILSDQKTQTRRVKKGPAVCHVGCTGDRLWVRETWKLWEGDSFSTHGEPLDPDVIVGPLSRFGEEYLQSRPIEYFADSCGDGPWRPSILMPRWASRINLEIVAVSLEKLQDISEADAKAEGVKPVPFCSAGRPTGNEHIEGFEILWDEINAKRGHSWDSNPLVWVIEFRRAS